MAKKSRNTKEKIVTAAWDLFYNQGYDGTTIDDIVERSGTSKGSFYHYFESKDALLSSLSYLFDEKYESLADCIDPEADALDTLIFLNQELFDMIDNKIDQTLISKLYSTQFVMRGDRSLLDSSRYYYRLLKQIISEGQEKGQLINTMTANEIVRYYAMCERALISEWCLCNWSFSLKSYSARMLPMLLQPISAKK